MLARLDNQGLIGLGQNWVFIVQPDHVSFLGDNFFQAINLAEGTAILIVGLLLSRVNIEG